jgi:hypothetical protein
MKIIPIFLIRSNYSQLLEGEFNSSLSAVNKDKRALLLVAKWELKFFPYYLQKIK